MLPTNDDHPQETTPRPIYLERLDESISLRRDSVELLEAVADELKKGEMAKSLRHLAGAIRSNLRAEEVLQDRELRNWLPWIVERRDENKDHSDTQFENREGLLERLTINRTRSHSQWLSLLYPFFLVLLFVLVFVLLSLTVIPVFAKMFREFGLRLPFPTRIVLGLSDSIQSRPIEFVCGVLLMLGVTVVAFRWLPRLINWGSRWSIVRFWTSGTSYHLDGMCRFLDILAAMRSLGASCEESINIAGKSCGNGLIEYFGSRLATEFQQRQNEGVRPVGEESKVAHYFPRLMLNALLLSESTASQQTDRKSDSSVSLLDHMSRWYRVRLQQRSSGLQSVVGPIVIVLIGILIGFVVIALFLPLISLVTSLSGGG
jgi:type IV pilus assembly protein PilC